MLQRLWLNFRKDLLVWLRDPITVAGGFIAPLVILVGVGLMFSGFGPIDLAIFNADKGPSGAQLARAIWSAESTFGGAYFGDPGLSRAEAEARYRDNLLVGIIDIPADFSARLAAGEQPTVRYRFTNYHDDFGKNARLYVDEGVWLFYQQVYAGTSPVTIREVYPADRYRDWFPSIAAGVLMLSAFMGGMFNCLTLLLKENQAGTLKEYQLAPVSWAYFLLPKLALATLVAWATAAVTYTVTTLWAGLDAGGLWGQVLVLITLVTWCYVGLAMVLGMMVRQLFVGGVVIVLSGVLSFFLSGGMAPVENATGLMDVVWRVFPNGYAMSALRDVLLFQRPGDLGPALAVLVPWAAVSLGLATLLVARRMRHAQA
ncbi:MAG: ABC transporter permease [Chloroflexi bacterium]|nr:ABC transporter permease [Chloroflexota bacterium]MBU1751805.1 ABC transporter permease [Chloroflexota bacterium]MBU1879350.1 ABC transporter permease [Chloroflexota bacterium]